MTEEEKVLEAYDIEHNPDADLVGGSISIAVCDMGFPDKKDVKRWLEALGRREEKTKIMRIYKSQLKTANIILDMLINCLHLKLFDNDY